MKVLALTEDLKESFFNFCRQNREVVDDSFLYENDLISFELTDENPTYIILNEQHSIVAAASLLLNDYYIRGKQARFRIFLSIEGKEEHYTALLEKIMQHTHQLKSIYCFVKTTQQTTMNILGELSFYIDRYAFALVRDTKQIGEWSFANGYTFRPFVSGQDEQHWCDVRNAAFSTLKGSETPITPKILQKSITNSSHIDGGMKMLFLEDVAVGVIGCENDELDGKPCMNIGPIAVLPAYQGKGLGRTMLRAALQFAAQNGYENVILSVNAENTNAKKLYIQEGFTELESVACYHYNLQNDV